MATLPRSKPVVGLSWGNFLDWLAGEWTPGKHMALIGPTGEGKTSAAIGMLDLRKWVLALDAKGMDDTLSASGYERIHSWPPSSRHRDMIAEGYPLRLIVGGPARTEEETGKLAQALRDAVEGVRAEGGWCLFCDEFQLLADRRMSGVTSEIEKLLISARTRGTSVVTAFQAPAWVPKASTRQASIVCAWGTRDIDMVKNIAQSMGRDWHELHSMVRELPEFHFLAIPKQFRDPVVLTHPPRVG